MTGKQFHHMILRQDSHLKAEYTHFSEAYTLSNEMLHLNQNEEYAIVKSNTEYGLSVYDHIVLVGESVDENDFIY